jgi:hypothetical protein
VVPHTGEAGFLGVGIEWRQWWQIAEQGPDKATELAGHGYDGFLPAEAALEQHPEAAVEPGLGGWPSWRRLSSLLTFGGKE